MQDTTQVQATQSNTQQAGLVLGLPVTAVRGTQHQLVSAGSAAAGVQSGYCPGWLLPVLCATTEAAACAETGEQQARGSSHASGVLFAPAAPHNHRVLLCDMAEVYDLVTAWPVASAETGEQQAQGSLHKSGVLFASIVQVWAFGR